MDSDPHDKLVICIVIHGELSSQFFSFQDFRMFLMNTGVHPEMSNEKLFLKPVPLGRIFTKLFSIQNILHFA